MNRSVVESRVDSFLKRISPDLGLENGVFAMAVEGIPFVMNVGTYSATQSSAQHCVIRMMATSAFGVPHNPQLFTMLVSIQSSLIFGRIWLGSPDEGGFNVVMGQNILADQLDFSEFDVAFRTFLSGAKDLGDQVIDVVGGHHLSDGA